MRKIATALMTLGLVVVLSPAALAGNMAITSFDSIPDEFAAGETYTLTYSVLQHGVSPVDDQSALIFTNTGDGQVITFVAQPTGEPGRYRVDVSLPTAGAWEWQVTQGPFEPQQMGVLTVEASTSNSTSTGAATSTAIVILRILLPLATLGAGWFTVREAIRSRSVVTPIAVKAD